MAAASARALPLSGTRPEPVRQRGAASRAEEALVVVIGAGCGLSAFAGGFYDQAAWGPAAVALLVLLLGLVLAGRGLRGRAALVAMAGLGALWLLSRLSAAWAESSDQAAVEGGRWLLYAALLAVLLILVRGERSARLLIGSAAGGVMVVAGYVVGAMLIGEGESLFFVRRLHDPLGYANGQAAYFMLAFWPFVALAENEDRPVLSALAIAAATVLAALALLPQTRAVLLAIVLSVVVLAVALPGRGRRIWALMFIGLSLSAFSGPLLDVYQQEGAVDPDSLVAAARATLAAAVIAGLSWFLAGAAARHLLGRRPQARRALASASALALTTIIVGGAVATLVVVDHPIERIRAQVDAFVELKDAGGDRARFLSAGGNRYDYWRIAARQFRDHPVRGVGAGNYDRTYFVERATSEDVRQPHSIQLQTLAELGLLGGIALFLFLAGVLAGMARAVTRRGSYAPGLAVAGIGTFLVWLGHTSVDWLHLIPGVTGIALCSAAALLALLRPAPRALARSRALVAVAAIALATVVAAAELGTQVVGLRHLTAGRAALPEDPRRALARANDSLELNGDALPALYLKAAAHARLDDYPRARASLLLATRLEEHDFVTWGLLGDIAVRRGRLSEARRYYGRASALNPRDPSLSKLAADPASALGR